MREPLTRWLRRIYARLVPERDDAYDLVEGIVGPVHRNDPMIDRSELRAAAWYVKAATSALDAMEVALRAAGRDLDSVERVLDFGCGYGRVTRLLRQRLPSAAISASDINPRAVRFCARHFGVRGVVSRADARRLILGEHDLIWVGSVFTHLLPDDGRALFRVLRRSLLPGGVLVLSFHGRFSLDHLGELYGGLYAGEAGAIRHEVQEKGVSYRPYPEAYQVYTPGRYGMAWHNVGFFDALAEEQEDGRAAEVERVSWVEQGWDSHHDVLAYRCLRS